MPDSVACEHCGKPVQRRTAEVEMVEDWAHYFCSEACKINWGEQAPLEIDDDT